MSDTLVMVADDEYCTDELTTVFYVCARCGYTRVPYGSGLRPRADRCPEHDARFCPGCGCRITWRTKS